jgi:hypothetical protein
VGCFFSCRVENSSGIAQDVWVVWKRVRYTSVKHKTHEVVNAAILHNMWNIMYTKCGISFNFVQLSSNGSDYECSVCLWLDYTRINRILSLQVLRITLLYLLILVFGKTLQGKHARWTFPVTGKRSKEFQGRKV